MPVIVQRVAVSQALVLNQEDVSKYFKLRLTIFPRLNSLNQVPGDSFGQLDIRTCREGEQRECVAR